MQRLGGWKFLVLLIPALALGVTGTGCRSTFRPTQATGYCPGCNAGGGGPQALGQSPGGQYAGQTFARQPTTGGLVLAQYTDGDGPPAQGPVYMEGPDGKLIPMPGPAHDGPAGHPPVEPGPMPRELQMVSHPAYTVAPPDILVISAERLLPKPPYRLQGFDVLGIQVTDPLPNQPIAGKYTVFGEGTVNLGYAYGSVPVAGMTVPEAQTAIQKHLGQILRNPQVVCSLDQFQGLQQIQGQHLVRPDGTISLGMYGSVYVAGMTIAQIRHEIEGHLAKWVLDPQVSVDVFAYNSKKYYVIADGAGFGQYVKMLPYTGNETVLDAIGYIGGLPPVSSDKYIWVARPAPCGNGCTQILPVDWQAIVQGGATCTNYQLFPGDRIYIRSDGCIRTNNYITKWFAPWERALGITLLGATLTNSINATNQAGPIIVP